MSDPLLANILSNQGEGGSNTNAITGAGSVSLGTNNQSTSYLDSLSPNTSSLTGASNSVTQSASNLSTAVSNRDTALGSAFSGTGSPANAIAADKTLTAADLGNVASQDSYLQYASNLPTDKNLGTNNLANSTLYRGDALSDVFGSSNNGLPVSDNPIRLNPNSQPFSSNVSSDRRIRLRPKEGIKKYAGSSQVLSPLIATNGMMFPYTPDITISRSASYTSANTVHSIQEYRAFTNNPTIDVNVNGTFTAQNKDEAYYLLAVYHFVKTASTMSFGQDSLNVSPPGMPPPVLLLSGYGAYNFNDLPFIITEASMDYPSDVDYISISTDNGVVNLPVKTTIHIKGFIQNTPAKLRQFDWGKYVNGSLIGQKGWF